MSHQGNKAQCQTTNTSPDAHAYRYHYVVGDIQGCYDQLIRLLELINFDPNQDKLWLTGDLVARGPKSLETLRLIKSLSTAATTVLGNHDLHLLATYHQIKKIKAKDKLEALFAAPDLDELINWLKQQPLLVEINVAKRNKSVIMTHAGISPQWTINEVKRYAHEAESCLRGPNCIAYLEKMYQNIDYWHDELHEDQRFCYIINSLTRMRYCYKNGQLNFKEKSAPSVVTDPKLQPWYQHSHPDWSKVDIAFGHFASIQGRCPIDNIFALDTGCIWGGELTLICLNNNIRYSTS